MSGIRVGVVGYGYWGPNVVRNLYALDACDVVAVSDKNARALERAHRTYPGLRVTTDAAEVLTSPTIDAVAVITPVWTHYELAKTALENGPTSRGWDHAVAPLRLPETFGSP